jgi:hypothetical protein
MRLLVLSAAIAATVLGVLPASAEVVVRAGEGGVAVHEHDGDRDRHHEGWRHHRAEGWRHHRAECTVVREKVTTPSGRVIFKTRSTC